MRKNAAPIIKAIESYTGIELRTMKAEGKSSEHVIHARNLLIYALIDILDYSLEDAAKIVNRNRSTCYRGYIKVQKWRRHMVYNKTITAVLAQCRSAYRKEIVKRVKGNGTKKRN